MTTRMDTKDIMLSGIKDRQIPYDFTYKWNLRMHPKLTKQNSEIQNRLGNGQMSKEGQDNKLQTSSKDEGIATYALLPCTAKRRTTTNLKTKKN